MKIKKIIAPIVVLCLVAGASQVSYQAGKDSSNAQLAALQSQVDSLRQGEVDAAVTRRVSKQMEEIAYQQKDISDEQRYLAEEQSKLAIKMRDSAELQSKAARAAEAKAVEAATEAKKQKLFSQAMQVMAEQQRDQANASKRMSDTLNYRSIGRTMGATLSSINDDVDKQIPSLLAYGSWMFLDRYIGNTYYPETFKGLEQQSGLSSTTRLSTRSAIESMATLPEGDGCVAVSNYGDVVKWTKNQKTSLLHDKQYDFRAVQVNARKKHIYALSFHGPLVILNLNGISNTAIALPQDKYFDMVDFDGQRTLLVGSKTLTWFSNQDETLGTTITLPRQLSCVCKHQDKLCLFYADGSYGELDSKGNIKSGKGYTKEIVTAAVYSDKYGCFFLGTDQGYIILYNKFDRFITEFSSHNSRITRLDIVDGILISMGYDRVMRIWNMLRFQLPSGCDFVDEMNSPIALQKGISSSLGTEWVSSVDYSYNSWPLAFCGSDSQKRIWMGTGDGEMVTMNISASEMAATIKQKLKRNLTRAEWKHYVGANIPYEKFK